MSFREFLHHELAAALNSHHEDPVVQQLGGLRRIGAAVYSLEDEIKASEGDQPDAADRLRDARCYYAAAMALVTFADAFVLDAFLDPDHPNHVPHVTYLQARQFYLQIPNLVTAVRKELAYPGSSEEKLPILCGQRIEMPGRCPIENLLAMKRAAEKMEEAIGTRIELLQKQSGGERVRSAVLLMTEARTKREMADQVIGAVRSGSHVPQETHEQAEAFYYDGVLRAYLYAAQELEKPGVAHGAPNTENDEEDVEPAGGRQAPSLFNGPGATSMGIGFGQLFAADMLGNLVGDLLGGMFGGGMFGGGMFGGGNWF